MHPRHKPTSQHHRQASPHYSGQKRRFRIQISNSFKKIYSDTKKIVAKTSTNFGHQSRRNTSYTWMHTRDIAGNNASKALMVEKHLKML
jgi:hypothetical protein